MRRENTNLSKYRINLCCGTIAVILIVLWALGLVSGYALGGFIHLILVVAIIVIVLQLVTGRRSL